MSDGFQQVLDHIRSIADSEFEKGQVDRRYIPTPVGRLIWRAGHYAMDAVPSPRLWGDWP